jgi:hypothetical protein
MLKFFRIPFANSGDKAAVPDATAPGGEVSYTQGYGFDYQRPSADPAAKNIERDKMNQLFFELTTALQELQAQGVPDFITSALNGGTAYSYSKHAIVRYLGVNYVSLENANTALPSDTTKWAPLPTAEQIQRAAYTSAVAGGTADAITAAFVPAIAALPTAPGSLEVSVRASAANTSSIPTFSPNGLAAKRIVKQNNQPLSAGDIPGAGAWINLRYDATLDRWVLLNPSSGAGDFVNLTYSGFLSGGTGIINIGAGQFYKEVGGNIGIGTTSPSSIGGAIRALTINGVDGGGVSFASGGVVNGIFYSSANSFRISNPTPSGNIAFDGNLGEIARFQTTSGNLLINTVTDTGEKLQVNGSIKGASFSGAGTGLTGTASNLTAGAVSSSSYLSSVLTTSTVQTFAHGLGRVPIIDSSVLQVSTANNGYSIGDQIHHWVDSQISAADCTMSVVADAANIYVICGSSTNFSILNKSTAAPVASAVGNFRVAVNYR